MCGFFRVFPFDAVWGLCRYQFYNVVVGTGTGAVVEHFHCVDFCSISRKFRYWVFVFVDILRLFLWRQNPLVRGTVETGELTTTVAMSIYFKMKNTPKRETIHFDGMQITLRELKQHIIKLKNYSGDDIMQQLLVTTMDGKGRRKPCLGSL